MSITSRIPGMKSGHTIRNVIVGFLYLGFWPFIIAGFPLIVPVSIGFNYRGVSDKLARLPGISAGGGVVSGAISLVYVFVLFGRLW